MKATAYLNHIYQQSIFFFKKYILRQKDYPRVDWRLAKGRKMRWNNMKPWCLELRQPIILTPKTSVWDCCVLIHSSQAWPAYKASAILPTFWFSRTWWQEVLTISFSTCSPVMWINTILLSYCSAHYILMTSGEKANLCVLYLLKCQTVGVGDNSPPELAYIKTFFL